jgi:hypothetical protein
MIHAAGDVGILIDFGDYQPGSILQRREGWFSDVWRDYKVDGKAVTAPFDIQFLPPGEDRLNTRQS